MTEAGRLTGWLMNAVAAALGAVLVTATVTTQHFLFLLGTAKQWSWGELFLLHAPTFFSFAIQAAIIARVSLRSPPGSRSSSREMRSIRCT